MAATAASGLDVSPISADLSSPKESGYAPCLRAGDFIFIAGQLARDDTGCIAAEAQVPDGQLWKGTRIKLETDYLIRNRLVPALDRSGSNLNLILKAQVYLSQETDLPAFWQVWEAAFEGKAPPTTVVPVKHPGFGTREATLEINVIAAHVDAAERIIDIDSDVGLTCPNMLAARKLDELVFCAGLMATDSQGLCSSAHPSACGPYFDDATGAQMEHILEKASQLLDEAGTDLAHVVRALHFQSDLSRFSQAYDKWRDRIGDVGLPFTSIQVNESVFVPGASLILDLIAYAPTKGN
jgi:enamine deaminase RidA (YjgF/YER057c/UK114 family)